MRRTCVVASTLCACLTALAAPPKPMPIGDEPMQYSVEVVGRGGDIVVYSNLDQSTDPAEFYVPTSQPAAPYGDDVHMTAGGELSGFKFVYYDPPGGTALTQARVTFFENDVDNLYFPGGAPSADVIDFLDVAGLPGDGLHTYELPSIGKTIDLPEHIWVEVEFLDSDEAGLVLHNPPSVGSSQDLFYVNGDDKYVFGYPYVASFGFAISVAEEEEHCPGDFDDNGVVNLSDLAILLGNYGTTTGAEFEDGDGDEDGDVDLGDLALLLGYYGNVCE